MGQIKSQLLFREEAQAKLLSGAYKLYDAVSTSLGPQGRNVAILKVNPYGDPYDLSVIHDGVSIAKAVNLEDPYENMGAQILKEAAMKTVEAVGDGTTLVTVLGYSIFKEINTLIAAGVNPMELRKSIEAKISELTTIIEDLAIPLETFEQKKQIATISAADPELGELVAKVIDEMGRDGLVSVEEYKGKETLVEKQEGMQLSKGYMSDWFMTNPDRQEATLENPLILATDINITDLDKLGDLLRAIAGKEKLVILSPHVGAGALGAMIQNKMQGVIPNIIITAPEIGDIQKATLQDIAIFTGGTFVSQDAGFKLEEITADHLGRAQYVTSTKSETIIVGGKGKKEAVNERIEAIKTAISNEAIEFNREKMKERLAKLTTGVAVIKVGGATEVEMKERLERVKDAVAATRAALEKGIVPGGETIFLQAREKLTKSDDYAYRLLYKALYKPFEKLLSNAGLNDGEWYEKLKHVEKNYGIDVTTGEMINMVEKGIVDPAAVPINALINASSVAIQLATTGALINQYVDKVDQKK